MFGHERAHIVQVVRYRVDFFDTATIPHTEPQLDARREHVKSNSSPERDMLVHVALRTAEGNAAPSERAAINLE